MRIALILLSILAMIFIGGVSWTLLGKEGGLVKLKTPTEDINTIALETWKNQIKTDEKIEKLSAMIQELKVNNPNITTPLSPQIGSGEKNIKISGKLLELIMPQVSPTLITNKGIFGLYIFDQSIAYSTYEDSKFGLTIIPMSISYDAFLKNTKALLGKPYSVNEAKTFPMRSFYLNPEKTDTLVRLVIEIESQTIALETTKSNFPTLKNLLLTNNSGATKSPSPPKKK